MAEKENYIINVQGELMEVSPDVYQLYFRLDREELAQEDRVQRHEVSYDALDNGETVGAEMFADEGPTPEEQAITNEIYDKLHRAIESLPRAERELIKALYFDDIKPEDYAKSIGMTVRGVNKRRVKSLLRIKEFCNLLGIFADQFPNVFYPDGTPCEGKLSCTVWSGGKFGDYFKELPITIAGCLFQRNPQV